MTDGAALETSGDPLSQETVEDTGLWRLVEADLRKVAAVAWAGALTGFVVLGWGSRLAMLILARLNPKATGRLSDDGFRMGEFNLDETMGLVLFCTVVGVIGGLIFLVLRQLRFGPPWFRTWSMVIGPGVVGGNLLVHTDGIDFRILEPAWLAIALFVVVPGAYAGAVAMLADRWLAEESWFRTGPTRRLALLVPFAPAFVVVPLVGVAIAMHVSWQRTASFRRHASRERLRTATRVVVSLAFVAAVADLARKTVELV